MDENVQPESSAADAMRPPPVPPSWAPRIRLGWSLGLLVLLLALLILPSLVEQIEYSLTRGRERAEAEVARARLARGGAASILDYRYVVKAIQSSVVGVKAVQMQTEHGQQGDEWSFFLFGPRSQYLQDQGSGVVVDASGYIITNYHVIDRASDVTVKFSDGSQQKARLVGADPATDLAVLKVEAAGLTAAPWGDSAALETGDPVLAIGNPFGLERTVTAGIVSAKGRHAVVENIHYQDFLQTDAAVNPGSSGGPLVNVRGEVVGINTAIQGPTYHGISFAIPSNLARRVYDQLVATGKVARGWLGVSMQELTRELADKLELKSTKGALVAGVVTGSAAEQAGLRPGDLIVEWNGKEIATPSELSMAVAWAKIGQRAKVTIVRDGSRHTFTVTVGSRPEQVSQ